MWAGVCKDLLSERSDVTVEDVAMNQVILDHVRTAFVASGQIQRIRNEMAVAAYNSQNCRPK